MGTFDFSVHSFVHVHYMGMLINWNNPEGRRWKQKYIQLGVALVLNVWCVIKIVYPQEGRLANRLLALGCMSQSTNMWGEPGIFSHMSTT